MKHWPKLTRLGGPLLLALSLASWVTPAQAVGVQFDQSLLHKLTESAADQASKLTTKSKLALDLSGFSFSWSLERLDEAHSVKLTLSRRQELVKAALSVDLLGFDMSLEQLQLAFPHAPIKDKQSMIFKLSDSATLEALTVKGALSLEQRLFPNKTGKDELLRDFDLTGSWSADLWELSVDFQNVVIQTFSSKMETDLKLGHKLQTELDLTLGGWQATASLSQAISAFPQNPLRDESDSDFDRALQLDGELSGVSLTLSGALTDRVRPLDPAKEKHFRRLIAQLAGVFFAWQLTLKLSDELSNFSHDAKKNKGVRKRQLTAERSWGRLDLTATLKDSQTDLANDAIKNKRFSESSLKALWSLDNAGLTLTLKLGRTRFPNDKPKDFDQENLDIKLEFSPRVELDLSLLSGFERKRFPHDPGKDKITVSWTLALGLDL